MLLSAILLKGTLAARPAANTLGEGVLYAATDNGIIYQVQSAAWVTWYPAPAGTGTVTNVGSGTGLTGGPITNAGTLALADTAVTPGTYGDSGNVGVFTVDAQGRITAASEAAIAGGGGTPGGSDKNLQYNNAGAFGGITNNATATKKYLQQVSSGTPTLEQVSGADLTADSVGPTQLADTAVTPATYGDSANVPVITVDAQGRITAASEAAVSGGGGGLTLVEHKLITANATSVTFSSLDGNTDGIYQLRAKIKNSSGGASADYTWRPNGVTTNQASRHYATGAGITDTTTLQLAIGNSNGNHCQIDVTIDARANPDAQAFPRTYQGQAAYVTSTPANGQGVVSGIWNETSTNLTSLDVVASTTDGIGRGSELWLYKLQQ